MKRKTNLLIPFILNLLFTVFEFVGGLLTNSIALTSDAVHDFGDALSIGLALIFERMSHKKKDEQYTYGYSRYSLLGGLISAVVLIIGSVIILYEAIPRLFHPQAIDVQTLLWFSIFGVVVNVIAALYAKRGKSSNEKIISLHLLEDALGWVALLLGAIAMNLWNVPMLDALLSIGFTLYILWHVIKQLRQVVFIMLEKAPSSPQIEDIRSHLLEVEGVLDVHHLHLWSLHEGKILFTAHVVTSGLLDTVQFVKIQEKLHEEIRHFGITHATFEFEVEGHPCTGDDCDDLEEVAVQTHHH